MNTTLITQTLESPLRVKKSSDIAHTAINVVRSADVDHSKLKRQLKRGGITCIISLIAAISILLFIVFGPKLQEPVSLLVILFLITSLVLFVVAVFTTIGPLITTLAYEKLQLVQANTESLDLQEEAERMRELLLMFREADVQDLQKIKEKHKDDLDALLCT
ncbi:hypothetical protein L0337_06325 [candidate division KSB1 bacterium]|nr:hypothetical protein [candidate division KSB1 bacterium]